MTASVAVVIDGSILFQAVRLALEAKTDENA
jgi:hypothetical protein